MKDQLLATFYVNNRRFNVYGIHEDDEYTNQDFDFYDLFEEIKIESIVEERHLNEGDPFYIFPMWEDIRDYIEAFNNEDTD